MIRVVISRHISQGCLSDYHELVRTARKKAIGVEGFIAGEIFQEHENANHAIIISSWEELVHWENWYSSQERQEISQKITSLLDKEERITILESCQSGL